MRSPMVLACSFGTTTESHSVHSLPNARYFAQAPGSEKHTKGIERLAKQFRNRSIAPKPDRSFQISTAIAPATKLVVVEIAGMIFPAIFFTVFRSTGAMP